MIQQYYLKNEANYNSRKGKNQSIKIINKNISQNPNLSTVSLNNISSLDMDKLKFYSTKKINEFTSGYKKEELEKKIRQKQKQIRKQTKSFNEE